MEYIRLSEAVKIKKISETDTEGVFEIEGLYVGYGLTVGNALRRALLSSLPGAAVTQIKIKGVKHEFSAVNGIKEDVIEIIANLKRVRFKFFADEPQTLTLKTRGERDVKAKDIETNSSVEIINPEAYIAALTNKNSELDMELVIEKGLGYAPVESRKAEKLPVGVIAIDAFFTPVLNVNFTIENMRVGERTDYNRLIISIKTDGSIAPSSALHKAANVLRDHIDKISAIETREIKELIKTKEKKIKKEKAVKKSKK